MPQITTSRKLLDSSGQLANGWIYFTQTDRYDTAEGIVTTTRGKGKVTAGVLKDASGTANLVIPETPEGQAVNIYEDLGGLPVQWVTQVPAGAEVEYGDLPQIVPPTSGAAIPAWVQDLLAVPGLIDGQVELAQDAATEAAASAASISKGTPNGVAGLDGAAKVPESQIPDRLSASSLSGTFGTLLDSYTETLGQFELVPVYADGHSFLAGTSSTIAGGRFWERIVKRLNMGGNILAAVSGSRIGLHSLTVLGGALAYPLNSKRFPIAMCATNDAQSGGSAPVTFGFSLAWRAYLAAITARAAVAANTLSFAYSAGFTTQATATATGGTRFIASTVGRYFEFTYTESGTGVDIFFVARPTGAGLVTITDGATTLGTLDLTAATLDECSAVFRVRGRANGTRTIRATLTSGASMTVDGYRIPSPLPVPGLILAEGIRDPNRGNGDVVTPDGSTQNTVLMNVLKPILAGIVAEYPSMTYLDISPHGWNPVTMAQDGLHPNDRGASFIAALAVEAMSQKDYGQALNVIHNEDELPAYAPPAGPSIPSGGQDGTGRVPGQVSDLTASGATAAGGQIVLSWSTPLSVPGLTDYLVRYRVKAGPGAWNTFTHTASTATTRAVTGLTNGTEYELQVQPIDGTNTWPFSNIAAAVARVASVADDFNRANGAPGSTPVGAKAWTLYSADSPTFAIVNNHLEYTVPSATNGILACDVGAADGTLEATVDNGLLAFRLQDKDNYMLIAVISGYYGLRRRTAGSLATVTTPQLVQQVVGQKDRLQVIMSGQNITLYVNGVLAFGPVAANFFTTQTKAGAYGSTLAGTTMDDFVFSP